MAIAIAATLLLILFIEIIIDLFHMMEISRLKDLLKVILYNLRRIEGALSHDNLRINSCIKEIQKIIKE